MDDPGDVDERLVLYERVAAKDRLEADLAAVVAELDTADVERGRILGDLVWVVDEEELGVGVDKAADQPSAGSPVDVDPGACRPPHAAASSTIAARASTARSASSRSGGGK